MNALGISVTSGRFALHIPGARLGAVDRDDRPLDRRPQPGNFQLAGGIAMSGAGGRPVRFA
jgi:hypothetical protein